MPQSTFTGAIRSGVNRGNTAINTVGYVRLEQSNNVTNASKSSTQSLPADYQNVGLYAILSNVSGVGTAGLTIRVGTSADPTALFQITSVAANGLVLPGATGTTFTTSAANIRTNPTGNDRPIIVDVTGNGNGTFNANVVITYNRTGQ